MHDWASPVFETQCIHYNALKHRITTTDSMQNVYNYSLTYRKQVNYFRRIIMRLYAHNMCIDNFINDMLLFVV